MGFMGTPLIQRLRRSILRHDELALKDGDLLEGYLARRDPAAFELLVRRHGPMVLGVCRRILGNAADADDAFQATFLVLVHKANSIRPRSLVSHWLYGVARNTALKARERAHKRRDDCCLFSRRQDARHRE
jgi:DNA-directed RNA polymerase specialized sigma24 family protein